MSSRLLTHGTVLLGLLLVPWPAQARTGVTPAVRSWLSALVTRIDAVDRTDRRGQTRGAAGTVVVHVAIAPDGSVRQAEIESSSGSPGLDQRALRAVRGASPFKPPPAELLAETGVADLSVPVEFGP
ncbi:energy transducer TonB [Methylobacterium sp. J-072]|uniref:energy transducer TonB family protein n=1 Tax=Methylobacterium sp. J-072 TaxID=2836651 RepID=UPI001FB94F33|nr:energy transducer TonB [Methylobacterium sp. J-072]MCJ2092291.1 energy transducer TonB [Methylobacterium sp. J-072]